MADEEEGAQSKLELATVWLVIGGTLYAIGFLVVTFHLARYGVTTVIWLRPQYLVAGIWCVIPLLIFSAGLAMGVSSYAEPFLGRSHVAPKFVRGMRHFYGVVQGVFGFSFGFVLVYVAIERGLHTSQRSSLLISLKLGGYAFSMTLIIGILAFLSSSYKSEQKSKVPLVASHSDQTISLPHQISILAGRIMWAFAFLALAVLYVWYFSTAIYGGIPSTLGGGKSRTVVFLPGSSADPNPVILDATGKRSIPYQLILETDSNYYSGINITG
jgi:hypothetical protein